MKIILELIFKGLLQWLFDMIINITEYLASSLLNILSMDLSYFETQIPITNDIFNIILAFGWALLIGNLVFQATKSMATGLGFEGEDPTTLFTRSFVMMFFLVFSRQICDIGLGITKKIIELLQIPTVVQVPKLSETTFAVPGDASWLLVIIIGIVLVVQLIKLFFEIGERYVIVAILTILSPLAFSMGGSKSTGDILKGWVRMFASMCLMMILSVIFLKFTLSAMSVVPSGVEAVPWAIFVVAIARTGRKIDSIIARIGLNPAITGDPLGHSRIPGMLSYMVMKNIGNSVSKSTSSGKSGDTKAPVAKPVSTGSSTSASAAPERPPIGSSGSKERHMPMPGTPSDDASTGLRGTTAPVPMDTAMPKEFSGGKPIVKDGARPKTDTPKYKPPTTSAPIDAIKGKEKASSTLPISSETVKEKGAPPSKVEGGAGARNKGASTTTPKATTPTAAKPTAVKPKADIASMGKPMIASAGDSKTRTSVSLGEKAKSPHTTGSAKPTIPSTKTADTKGEKGATPESAKVTRPPIGAGTTNHPSVSKLKDKNDHPTVTATRPTTADSTHPTSKGDATGTNVNQSSTTMTNIAVSSKAIPPKSPSPSVTTAKGETSRPPIGKMPSGKMDAKPKDTKPPVESKHTSMEKSNDSSPMIQGKATKETSTIGAKESYKNRSSRPEVQAYKNTSDQSTTNTTHKSNGGGKDAEKSLPVVSSPAKSLDRTSSRPLNNTTEKNSTSEKTNTNTEKTTRIQEKANTRKQDKAIVQNKVEPTARPLFNNRPPKEKLNNTKGDDKR